MTTLKEALEDAILQIEYLHDRAGGDTGSGNSVIAKIRSALASLEGDAVERVARIIAGPLCDATNGEHSIAVQGDYRFCTQCGETISKRTIGIVEARTKARAILATGLVPDEAAIRADEREKCAKLIEPKRPRPCDCDHCDCHNQGDTEAVAAWDADTAAAAAIRSGGRE